MTGISYLTQIVVQKAFAQLSPFFFLPWQLGKVKMKDWFQITYFIFLSTNFSSPKQLKIPMIAPLH
jgi:hypothetical protein